jgi:predicted dehydrogenase
VTDPFRVLLVGAGEQAWESRGPSIQVLADDDVVLAALASPGDARRASTADRLGLERTYRSMGEALEAEPFDGVVIAAPNALHEPLTVEALAHGKHVLVEKPIATSVAGGGRMIDAASRAGRVLAVGYQYPWMHPGLIDLADAGALDTIFRVEARWTRAIGIPPQPEFWDRPDGGVAADLLGHLLSLALVAITAPARWVTATAWNGFGRAAYGAAFRAHDTLEALVNFEGGYTAHLVVAWDCNQREKEAIDVALQGHDLSIELPLMGREVDVERFFPTLHYRKGDTRVSRELTDPRPIQTEETFVAQARNWVRACRGTEPLRFPPETALEIQAILDAATASAASEGDPVAVSLEAT